jgi:hypothetical protein
MEFNMRPKVLVILLALGFVGAAVPEVMAQAPPTPTPDTTFATPDSAAAAPVVPAAAPAEQAPAPASTPPPAAAEAAATPATATESKLSDRIYYGGTVTLSFGSATRIGIFPMVGYKLTPKVSGGVEVGYEYVNYDDSDQSSHNYGGSVFGRYLVGRNLYAHGEYQAVNYDIPTGRNSSRREWVPFLLLGGGAYRMISARTSVYVEVLFDVLQDDKSPYSDWEPVVSFGVGVGF